MRRVTSEPVAPGSHARRTPRRLALCTALLRLALCTALLLLAGGATLGAAAPAAEAAASAAAASTAPRLARLSTTVAARTQVLTLTGRGFGERRGTSAVSFGSLRTHTYVSWSDGKIVCRVPTRARIGALRVRVVTATGTSNGRLLRVRRAIRLGTPRPVRPRGTIESTRPQLRWRAAANAGSYEVRVVLNGVTVLAQAGIEGRSLRLPQALPEGAPVAWRVRARRAGRVGAWSGVTTFRVRRRPSNGGETTYTQLALFTGNFVPMGYDVADGSILPVYDPVYWQHDVDAQVLFSLLHTAFGGDGNTTFGLPLAQDWPAGARPDDYGQNGRWLVAGDGLWPRGIDETAWPGQVMFSASAGLPWNDRFRQELAAQGAVSNPAGDQVFTGCAAYDVPADHDSPDASCLIGELRLFKETATLPEGFIPADGRLLETDDAEILLFSIIGCDYGGDCETTFAVPAVTAPDGYVWAIASEGDYPESQ